jgi:serine phosphatase RsbU (regulator of sigma subunit)/anti-sigma regulatory factor (Ser/Thr protein kinase)
MAAKPFERHSLTLDNSLASAGEGSVWARTLARQSGLSEDRIAALDLCIVELINNIVDHSYRGQPGEIRLELALGHGAANLTVIDDGPAFDPLSVPTPPVPASLDEATIGGLGIHLIRSSADACEYKRRQERNVFIAYFGDAAVRPRLTDRRVESAASFPVVRSDGTVVEKDARSGIDRRALGFISRCSIFRDVPYADLEGILSQCRLVDCPTGQVVLAPGGRASSSVLVVVRGSLQVRLEGPDAEESFPVPCGDCVGEISVADGKAISAWVVAGEPSQLLVIERDLFLDRLLAIPRVGRNLIILLAERMRRGNDWVVARTRAAAELKALHKELEVARRIQASMLLPSPLLAESEDIRCHAVMRAARQVGGDFYGALRLGAGRYFLAIGDVCGKGMGAALFMARTLTLLRGLALAGSRDPASQLAGIARKCNEQLVLSNEEQLFVSLGLAIVDVAGERLHYCSIGHCAPALVSPDGSARLLDISCNPVAGIEAGLRYRVDDSPFPAGSRILIYTDGVTEAERVDEEPFGEARMLRVLSEHGRDIESCTGHLLAAVDAFADGHPQSDDITFLMAGAPLDETPR